VFEQSYGGVEGDSASCAELCALLSALADSPIDQSLSITGSVNQRGEVQAVGGVNEKIEGFFDICRRRGLTGSQGVLIPAANVKHLMLRNDVREAAEAGHFHVYAVNDIDQAMEMLTGLQAGEAGPDGAFPDGTINQRVSSRLADLAEKRRKHSGEEETGAEG
jgi:predicted ATP-dependent protease